MVYVFFLFSVSLEKFQKNSVSLDSKKFKKTLFLWFDESRFVEIRSYRCVSSSSSSLRMLIEPLFSRFIFFAEYSTEGTEKGWKETRRHEIIGPTSALQESLAQRKGRRSKSFLKENEIR